MEHGADLLHLNIGGTAFTTTVDTLESPRSKNSFLSALVSPTRLPTQLDSSGRIFIDRDGERFRIILNWLRDGTVHVVDGTVPTAGGKGAVPLEALLEEARFYGLEELVRVVRAELARLELEESLECMPPTPVPKRSDKVRESTSPRRVGGVAELGRGVMDYKFRLDAEF